MTAILHTLWAALIPVLFILGCSEARAMDDIGRAAVYALDRSLCHLSIDQSYVDSALVKAGIAYNVPMREIILEIARVGTALEAQIREGGRTAEYCEARRVK